MHIPSEAQASITQFANQFEALAQRFDDAKAALLHAPDDLDRHRGTIDMELPFEAGRLLFKALDAGRLKHLPLRCNQIADAGEKQEPSPIWDIRNFAPSTSKSDKGSLLAQAMAETGWDLHDRGLAHQIDASADLADRKQHDRFRMFAWVLFVRLELIGNPKASQYPRTWESAWQPLVLILSKLFELGIPEVIPRSEVRGDSLEQRTRHRLQESAVIQALACRDLSNWFAEDIEPTGITEHAPEQETTSPANDPSCADPAIQSFVDKTAWAISSEPPPELLDQVTGQQAKLVKYLWSMSHSVDWNSLPCDAFRHEHNRQDGAVKKALERLQERLNEHYERFQVRIEITAETRRVKLVRDSPTSPDK